MIEKIKFSFQIILFIIMTLFLYLLYLLTAPICQDSHGFQLLKGLVNIYQGKLIQGFIFFTIIICALLGSIMMTWLPKLHSGIISNLWAMTFLFLWLEATFFLTDHNHFSIIYLPMFLGFIFLYLFFFIMGSYLPGESFSDKYSALINKLVISWLWGWMGFYFGLSTLLAIGSLYYFYYKLLLAFGAMALCFFNYLICFYLKKTEGKEMGRFSAIGRVVFILWFSILAALWIRQKLMV